MPERAMWPPAMHAGLERERLYARWKTVVTRRIDWE